MSLTLLTIVALMLWPIGEIALIARERLRAGAAPLEKGRATLVWIIAGSAVAAGIGVRELGLWRMPFAQEWLAAGGTAIVLIGFALRLWAVSVLGRHFSLHVVLQPDHQLVRSGPYRFVRHPAYAGLLLCFSGLGVVSASWLSWLVIVVPTAAVLVHRIRVEEQALAAALGGAYRDYQRQSWRLVPLVY